MAQQKDNRRELHNDSFEALFSRFARGMVVYAREFLSGEEAEDVVHDVFVSLWEKMDRLSADTARAYLFRATKNKCLDHLAHLKIRSRYQEDILRDQDSPTAADMDHYVESELRSYIESAINTLPPQRKKVFIMNRMEGKSPNEIATELDLSPRTVEKHIELASKSVRTYLSQYLSCLIVFMLGSM